MVLPLIRDALPDGTVAADSDNTINYIGGSPAGIHSTGVFGTLNDTHYCGVIVNQRATNIQEGNAPFYAGNNKLEIRQGAAGEDPGMDSNDTSDRYCPFDTTVNWNIGDDLFIRNLGTEAVWSNVNYDGGVSHGFVTKAPTDSADTMEAWWIERR